MRKSAIITLFIGLTLVCTAGFAEKLTKTKIADIKKLMDITGASQIGKRASEAMIVQLTRSLTTRKPNISTEALQTMNKVVRDSVSKSLQQKGGFIDKIIILYHKHFSHEDIKDLIAFNQSELGRKTKKAMPSLTRASIQEEQKWRGSLVPVIEKRLIEALKKHGVDLSQKQKK